MCIRDSNNVQLTFDLGDEVSLNRDDFLVVLHDYPKIAIQLLKEMTSRLRKSDRQIVSLSLSDAEKRIALFNLLLYFS